MTDAATFEAAILENLDDDAAYLVYADWLQSRGDPRGELIMLHHKGVDAAAHLHVHPELLGPLGTFTSYRSPKATSAHGSRVLALKWRNGFVDAIDISWGMFERGGTASAATREMREILEHPSCRFLRSLKVGPIPSDDQMSFDYIVDAIEEAGGPATLRDLYLGRIGDWDMSGTSTGTFSRVAKVCPKLRDVVLRGGDVTIGPDIDLPELRSFAVETGGLGRSDLEQLLAMRAPNLTSLAIWFGMTEYGGSCRADDLAPLFAGDRFPKLVYLGLKNCPWIDLAIEPLARSPILPHLEVLDLSMGALTDAGLATIVASRAAFAHLKTLDVDDNALSDAAGTMLADFVPAIDVGTQDPDRAYDRAPDDRYTAVGE